MQEWQIYLALYFLVVFLWFCDVLFIPLYRIRQRSVLFRKTWDKSLIPNISISQSQIIQDRAFKILNKSVVY
ncbi:MAG: hypothetical protein CL760_09015 [Chloroflexi bacterium]|nr:hypothetical protein [Chloroflexota bacterium]